MERNTLYYGDCLDILSQWDNEVVDLIYLDPPFNSNEKYSSPFKKSGLNIEAQIKAFDDMWKWDEKSAERVRRITSAIANPISKVIAGFACFIPEGKMLSYTSYMGERLFEMHRVLKPTGSIYLHCDPTASHYLKILMDVIFGEKNFRNEIVWCYPPGGRGPKLGYHRKHDILLFYGKAEKEGTFNRPYIEMLDSSVKRFNKVDASGRRYKEYPGGRTYLDELPGRPIPSWWTDINSLGQAVTSPERLDYPTQKPLNLLERIIKASSMPGDLVVDPFCGCGTTVEAARTLGRDVIGIDVLPSALDIINRERLAQKQGISPLKITGTPTDVESAKRLATESRFKFQDWAISLIRGFASNAKKSGDGGIDGFGLLTQAPDNFPSRAIIIQVKSGRVGNNDVPSFIYTLDKVNAAMGIFITIAPHRAPKDMAAAATLTPLKIGLTEYERLQFFSVEGYYAAKGDVKVQLHLPPLSNPWTGRAMQDSLLDKIGA